MYEKLAKKTTNLLINKEIINHNDREIYEYSFEVVISDIMYLIIAITTALITNTLIEEIIFLIGFLSIRKYAGGYHANTYAMCHLLSWINQLAMILLLHYTPSVIIKHIIVALSCTSILIVYILAPIENENRMFTTEERKRFKKGSRITVVIIIMAALILYMANLPYKYPYALLLGVFSVSMSLIAGKVKYSNRKAGERNEQES